MEYINPGGSAPVYQSRQAVLVDVPAGLEPPSFGRCGATGIDKALPANSTIMISSQRSASEYDLSGDLGYVYSRWGSTVRRLLLNDATYS